MLGPLLAWLLAASLVTAVLYAYDKLAAPRGMRRVRERTLLLLCLAGGVPGAWIVFLGMRHKTRHRSFWVAQIAASVLWAAVLGWVILH
ncbi:MAG: DUF1294 domain-containing protein [Chloroflexota bacterium]